MGAKSLRRLHATERLNATQRRVAHDARVRAKAEAFRAAGTDLHYSNACDNGLHAYCVTVEDMMCDFHIGCTVSCQCSHHGGN
jgi:hypothetical protein